MSAAPVYAPDAPAAQVVHVIQGDFFVSPHGDVVLTTVLGSCVAACMRDPIAGVGGMNHFLLPGALAGESADIERGVHAMEVLINALLHAGARRERLEAKLFGGARMIKNLSDIGAKNAVFAGEFLRQEGISCHGVSLGGERARRVRYWPVSGKAKQLLLANNTFDVFEREMKVAATPPPAPAKDVEFF